MHFPYFDETEELNDAARKEISGSFIALTDGVTHYEWSGNENGQPVVLVHGFSVPYFIYDPTFEFLVKSGFRVLRYDLFGRGFSDRPRADYNMRFFVRQLKDLLNALNLTQVHLVGLSMGGPISASFILEYPEDVSKHVLIDPSGAKRVQITWLVEAAKIPMFGELALGLLGSGNLIKGIASDLFDKRLVEHFQAQYKIQMQYHGFKRAILSTIRNGMLDSFRETYLQVGRLKKPTLLFWGRHDATVPYADSAAIMETLPHAEFHTIEGCGHIPHYEKPEVVNPILFKFLSKSL